MIQYFNPGHEAAVLNASLFYMPPASVLTMQHDLNYLPAWYSSLEDLIFITGKQDDAYIHALREMFPALPGTITAEALPDSPDNEICLWGISPQAIHLFAEIAQRYNKPLKLPEWKEEYRYLNSRKAAKDTLQELINKLPEISDKLLPRICTSIEEVEQLARTSPQRLLAKAPYSSSGRGLVWLSGSSLRIKEKEMLHGIIKKQQYVSIEPVLNKDTDFAMQFICSGKGDISFAGYSIFETNDKGAYIGNHLLAQEEMRLLLAQKTAPHLLEQVKYKLAAILKTTYASLYKGCIGVDMMIYKENGEYRLHPCLEINMRYNMGYTALKLQQNYILPSSTGKFIIDYSTKEKGIYMKHAAMVSRYPLLTKEGKIQRGYLSLCPVTEESRYMGYVIIQ